MKSHQSESTPGHCTLALTDALLFSVNVHVLTLFPPLEQAPDQIASRPFVTLNVIDVPAVKVADPLLPTATLMPAGDDVMRSPLRPVALTVSVAVPPVAAGFTVTEAVRVTALYAPLIVAVVDVVTVRVVTANVALVAPAATVTLAGTVAAEVLLLDSVTTAPPEGAADVRVAVPCTVAPPVALDGLTLIADNDGGVGVPDRGVKLRTVDHAPAVPALLRPRTRHQCWRKASELAVCCDAVTVMSITRGVVNELESSTCS